jgi:hypothetical protein
VDRQPGSRERAFVRWKSIDTGHSAGDHCSTRRGDQFAAAHTAQFAVAHAGAADLNAGAADTAADGNTCVNSNAFQDTVSHHHGHANGHTDHDAQPSTLNAHPDAHTHAVNHADTHGQRHADPHTVDHRDAHRECYTRVADTDSHSGDAVALGHAAGITVTDAPANVTRIAAADANRHMLH